MERLGVTCCGMRAALAALLLMTSPALAGECAYYNQAGQRLEWRGDTVTFDPLYTDPVICTLKPIPDTNGFNADCGSYSETMVTGASTIAKSEADILVWGNVFYWFQCAKDHA